MTLEDVERAHILRVLEELRLEPDARRQEARHRSRHPLQQDQEIRLEEDCCGREG